MMTVSTMRAWAEKILDASSVLLIERSDAGTRIALQFSSRDSVDCAIGECDVATLREIHKRRLTGESLKRAVRDVVMLKGA